MNTRYCSKCGKKHVYSAEKPRLCSCGHDMDNMSTFAKVVAPASVAATYQPLTQMRAQPHAPRRMVNARGRDMSQFFTAQSDEQEPEQVFEADDSIDDYQKFSLKSQMIASIQSSDFECGMEETDKKVNFRDIMSQAMANSEQNQSAQAKPSRKRARKNG